MSQGTYHPSAAKLSRLARLAFPAGSALFGCSALRAGRGAGHCGVRRIAAPAVVYCAPNAESQFTLVKKT
jgi:hypothetical protein